MAIFLALSVLGASCMAERATHRSVASNRLCKYSDNRPMGHTPNPKKNFVVIYVEAPGLRLSFNILLFQFRSLTNSLNRVFFCHVHSPLRIWLMQPDCEHEVHQRCQLHRHAVLLPIQVQQAQGLFYKRGEKGVEVKLHCFSNLFRCQNRQAAGSLCFLPTMCTSGACVAFRCT